MSEHGRREEKTTLSKSRCSEHTFVTRTLWKHTRPSRELRCIANNARPRAAGNPTESEWSERTDSPNISALCVLHLQKFTNVCSYVCALFGTKNIADLLFMPCQTDSSGIWIQNRHVNFTRQRFLSSPDDLWARRYLYYSYTFEQVMRLKIARVKSYFVFDIFSTPKKYNLKLYSKS